MEKYQSLLDNVKRYISLNNKEELAFTNIVKPLQVKKRQYIVQPNFICAHQTYVVKGALRSFLIDQNGIEHTLQFAIEDWFISDFNSYISQTPATLFVEALEDATLLQIQYEDVENLCSKHPVFERFFRLIAQKSFAYSQKRVLSNIGKSAEERYLDFYNLYPSIVQRVPQYMLASYLGMTPEFLSKIRSRTVKKS